MSTEEALKQKLIEKFGFLENKITTPRPRRIFVEVALENFRPVFEHAARSLGFSHLCTITGLDEQDKLSFIYHLAHESGILLNIKTSAGKDNPVLKTVMDVFPSAEIYEREVMDLFGAKVEGLPPGHRYPLPDDWPKDQFPLRKGWKQSAQ